MDIAYDGTWGYHPLVVSLANTSEPLVIVNRSGNRPSHEGAPEYFARAIALCRRAGWQDVLLRGDTAYSQASYFDRWDDDGVRFVFGYSAYKSMIAHADAIEEAEHRELVRRADELHAAGQAAMGQGTNRDDHRGFDRGLPRLSPRFDRAGLELLNDVVMSASGKAPLTAPYRDDDEPSACRPTD